MIGTSIWLLRRLSVVAIVALATALMLCAGAGADTSADSGDTGAAATALADRYSPILEVQPQAKVCGPGEGYRPTTVDILLENHEVELRNAAGRVIDRGPTAQELASAPASDYIDLPGDALGPGCHFEKQFKRWFGDREPTVYAHVTTDSQHPGKLAVQYWYFYTFNDFTNKHEGDWEMAQVDFDAATPEQALETGPYEVDLAQHAGGERGAWNDDPKLTKDGTHPVVYVATGSHAAYFQRELYIGKGGTAIFGCEDTRTATEPVSLHTVLIPDVPVPVDSRFAWLDFPGRWGERLPGINNGPLGPATDREAWTHPIAWSEGLRDRSLTVPGGRVIGLSVTTFFCGAVEHSAFVLNWGLVHPIPFLTLLGLIFVLAIAMVVRTSWKPLQPRPIRQARGCGQILRVARRLYYENPATFIGIGALFVPVSLLTGGVQWVLFHLTGLAGAVNIDGKQGAGTAVFALFLGDIGGAVAAVAVTGMVAAALYELDAGRSVTTLGAYRLAIRHGRELLGATVVQFALILVMVLSVIGIPFAIFYYIRTSLFAQTCVLEDRGVVESLRSSSRLTSGHFLRTFVFTAFVDALAILSGPLLGVPILLLTPSSLTFLDVSSSIVYALVVPYAAIALTLYYFNLQVRGPALVLPIFAKWFRRADLSEPGAVG